MCQQSAATAYFVTAQIETAKVVLLLDSGCSQSIMPRQVLQNLPLSAYTRPTPVVGQGVLADGQKIPLDGTTEVKLKLGHTQYTLNFLIADIDNHILLGFDFLRANQCTIDFKTNQLICGGRRIDCCSATGDPLLAKVQVKFKTLLPPRCEKIIPARLNRVWKQGTACVESTDTLLGVTVATSIHMPVNQDIYIRVLNYSDSEQELRSGQVVANCSAVGVVEEDISVPPEKITA